MRATDHFVQITSGSMGDDFGGASAAARGRAFRKARRHTVLVRVLRVLLPLAAIGLLASYGLFVRQSYRIQTGKGEITFGTVAFSTEALKAFDPKYEGFNTDGGRYVVIAKSAEQDFRQTGPIKLEAIDGRLTEVNNTVTRLKAIRGDYFDKSGILELYESIDVDSESGLKAKLTRATVNTKESRIESNEPVVVDMPGSTVRGRRMVLQQKKRHVMFSDGVETRLIQEQGKQPRPARPESAAGLVTGDGPIDIVSRQLAVDDLAKTALFMGDVVAKQGTATLTTPELEVLYEDGAATRDGAVPGAAATAPGGANRVRLIRAHKDVVMVNGTQRATGSSADFDQRQDTVLLRGPVMIAQEPDRKATSDEAHVDNKNDTILLTGTVVVTQARNVLRGRRMLVNRKSGTMQMTAPADASGPAGRVFARLYSAEAEAPASGAAPKKRPPAGSAPAASKGATLLPAAQRDPDAPIDVDASSLDVDDKAKTAIFRGNVVAVQGDYTVRTPELVALYTGDNALAFGSPPHSTAAGEKKSGSELRRVEARQKAVITTKSGESAIGDFAVFDPKTSIATITGDVTLTRSDGSVARGPKATMDMNSGRFNMEQSSAGEGSANTGPASVTFKGRPSLLIYPNKAKEAAKGVAKAPAKGTTAESAGEARSPAAAAVVVAPAPPPSPKTSGWTSPEKSPLERD